MMRLDVSSRLAQSRVMDDDPLTPDDAAAVIGVPAYQLRTWAYDRVGPVNVGTRWRPMYRERDLREWVERRASA